MQEKGVQEKGVQNNTPNYDLLPNKYLATNANVPITSTAVVPSKASIMSSLT